MGFWLNAWNKVNKLSVLFYDIKYIIPFCDLKNKKIILKKAVATMWD